MVGVWGVIESRSSRVVGEDIPHAARGAVRRDDLIAHVEHAAPGDLTVCAVGFSGDLLDPEARRRFFTYIAESDVKCKHIGPTDELVTLATSPQQRYDSRPRTQRARGRARSAGASP
jgi:hypothetical protein